MSFIEVCAGAGGLSNGFINKGFIPILLNDNDKICCETLKKNHNDAKIICDSFTNIDFINECEKKNIDILMGGVPCQSFSHAGKRGIARRLSMDEPCLTLTTSPSQKQTERCHPLETRPLNIREYARIQTFPDNYNFCGNIAQQYKQIGNAVPVKLAEHLAQSIKNILS